MPKGYDVTNVVSSFLQNKYPHRKDLIHIFTDAIRGNSACLKLVVEVAGQAEKNNLPPVDYLRLALMYGMTVGVLLEQDRIEREKR